LIIKFFKTSVLKTDLGTRHLTDSSQILDLEYIYIYEVTEFNDFCSSNGINHEVTAPYTPQHNGISERKNKTLVNIIRSMLKQKQMPPHYLWGEAAATAAYLINKSTAKKLQDKTPEEAWCGVNPSVLNLKVFCSSCFKHVPDQLRKNSKDVRFDESKGAKSSYKNDNKFNLLDSESEADEIEAEE